MFDLNNAKIFPIPQRVLAMPQRSKLSTPYPQQRSRPVGTFQQRTAVRTSVELPPIAESASEFRANLTAIPVTNVTPLQTKQHGPASAQGSKSSQGSGSGRSLPAPVRTKMERAFNTSFADVRVHEGNHAASVGAIAYTQGNNIHFAPGQFKPETHAGQTLLGHELAHVVQQRQGRVKPTGQVKGLPLNDNPALEQEADRLGRKAAQA